MPKRILLFFIGFVVLASLAYYGFSRWKNSREKVDLWALVPENAAFVVETNNHTALAEHLKETELWTNFSVLPFAQRFADNLAWIDSVAPGSQRLARFLDKKNILTSVHVVGKSEVDFVYYIPVNTVGEHRFLRTLTENINKDDAFKEDSREYQGFLLTHITNTQLGSSFTFFSYHNNIILSPSPVLVEEIVRRINRGNPVSVAADFKGTNYLNQEGVFANVFVNYRALPEVLALFLKEDLMPQVRYLASFCRNGMLELKLEQDKVFLNGFSNPENLKNSFYAQLQPAKPQPVQVKEFLPTRTAILLHFGLEEVTRLRGQARPKEATYTGIIDSLGNTFQKEVALAYLEAYNVNTSPEKIVFARMANPEHTTRQLKRLRSQATADGGQQGLTEEYGAYTLQLLPVRELPAQLFGNLFSGFEQSYVTQVGEYLVFAPEMSTLRSLLDDISSESVWGKSVTQKAFLEETLQEGNFSIYINSLNAWYILNRYMQDESREDLLQNASLIKRFNQASLQFSKVEQQYYTSFLLRRQERASGAEKGGFEEELVLTFDNRIISRPFAIQNAVDRSREIVVQDSAHVLHNITASDKSGWTDSLSSTVRGGIQQIEIGPDKKLRYVFSTASRIYAVDNQGNDLENFPFNVSDSLQLQRVSVFDYEKNGNYRLLADDELGNLYMYDIRGNAIQGWQPRRMDYRLATAPQHLRIGGRDVILVVLENGYVYALNREGETIPGFPFSLRSPVTSDAVVKLGSDLRRSEATLVTRYGEVVTFNLQGRILTRKQLLRPSKRAMFELVPENSGKSFIVVRQDQGKVAVFDQDLKEVFEKHYVTSAPKIVQYFHFGGGNKIYAITETGPQKTYLYNADAELIGKRSLESTQPVAIFHNEAANNYTLYKVLRRQLKKVSFRLDQ